MEPPRKCLPESGWFHQAVDRAVKWWPAKMAGTTVGMTVFFFVYFEVLRNPVFPVTPMPVIAIDRMIAFRPEALPIYLSLWVYVSLVPALLVTRRELVSCALAAGALSAIGLGIFHFWPTAVPPSDVDWSRYPAFMFLQTVDASGNACPSLHVAFAVFSAAWLGRALRQMGAGLTVRGCNWLWCLGILYSTIATRQHVALDVLAGVGLGAAVAAVSLIMPLKDEN